QPMHSVVSVKNPTVWAIVNSPSGWARFSSTPGRGHTDRAADTPAHRRSERRGYHGEGRTSAGSAGRLRIHRHGRGESVLPPGRSAGGFRLIRRKRRTSSGRSSSSGYSENTAGSGG